MSTNLRKLRRGWTISSPSMLCPVTVSGRPSRSACVARSGAVRATRERYTRKAQLARCASASAGRAPVAQPPPSPRTADRRAAPPGLLSTARRGARPIAPSRSSTRSRRSARPPATAPLCATSSTRSARSHQPSPRPRPPTRPRLSRDPRRALSSPRSSHRGRAHHVGREHRAWRATDSGAPRVEPRAAPPAMLAPCRTRQRLQPRSTSTCFARPHPRSDCARPSR